MTRNIIIDTLRLIGLLLIILAHVSPPEFLFQVRTFDVPLMIFVAGMSYYISMGKESGYLEYIKARFIRLVLPVWFFFTVFYILCYILNVKVFNPLLNLKIIFSTFLLNGFGYVWIIRVFLIIACISPLLRIISRDKKYSHDIYIMSGLIITATFLNYIAGWLNNKYALFLLNEFIISALSYSVVFILGLKWKSYTNSEKINVCFLGATTWVIVLCIKIISAESLALQDYKYPPQLYYILYSAVMAMILCLTLEFIEGRWGLAKLNNGLFNFISSNTIWIYLWHIPLVEYIKRSQLEWHFYNKYLFVLIIAISITYIQVKLVIYIVERNSNIGKIIKRIFTG